LEHPEGNTLDRRSIKDHLPAVLWFTGLSGSGKTTIAKAVEYELCTQYKVHTYHLDGDVLRDGLNRDLGFSPQSRSENIRRAAEVARLMADAGLVVLLSFISPFRADRENARKIISPFPFLEIFVNSPLAVCEQRDPKGLYRKARAGLIPEFTGISSPYEEPLDPEIILETSIKDLQDCKSAVIQYMLEKSLLR
jgi:adenylyl-sulfate kinase